MPLITYIDKNFSKASLAVIEQANKIIDQYLADGYCLTLRQLYYQFVARDLLPNKQSEYKRLGSIVSDARNAGMIDWNAIEDRTRNVRSASHWDSPSDILKACASQFRYDLWENQSCRVEVWIEKDALVGVFENVCDELDVPLFSCRGYTSQSEIWGAGRRLDVYASCGQRPVILHFGDHDPSGIDMTRDIEQRLCLYSRREVEVRRLALNYDQVEEYSPPPNPAKTTDSRYSRYVDVHGNESWELDALEPSTLASLVRTAVMEHLDEDEWGWAKDRQTDARERLLTLARTWKD